MEPSPFEFTEEEESALVEVPEEEVTLEPAEPEQGEEAEKPDVRAEEQKPKVKTVPHQALHAEREERKKAEERVRNLEAQFAMLNERIRIASQEPPAPPPDPEQDPIAALQYERQQREALQRQIEEQTRQSQQAFQQQTYERQVINLAQSHEGRFRIEAPDYDAAVQFLTAQRAAELEVWGLDPAGVEQQIRQEAISLAMQAAQRGVNFAEMTYNMAKARGYAPKPDTREAEEKIKTVSQAQERSKSLSSAGGKTGGAEMTVEQLLKMPPDEFDSWAKKNPAKMKALMGA